MARKAGFTLIDLLVTIVIIGILAAAVVPPMQGRIDKAKWSEANATAGTIRRAVRAYASETDVATAQTLAGKNLGHQETQEALGLTATGLEGTYFTASDYTITSVDASAVSVVTVVASKPNAPNGSYRLLTDGEWVKID
ncbi:MAG: type II secretion system protein [Phycisphaerales bacterium]|nr:MAG: type II secretion system protein [Phycisphaerales bacterium]